MKVKGGSFGSGGRAWFSVNKTLAIDSSLKAEYPYNEIANITADAHSERKFGAIGFVLGAIILAAIMTPFMGLLGLILGVVIAALGSFYTAKSNTAQVEFEDGQSVALECDKKELDKLYQHANHS